MPDLDQRAKDVLTFWFEEVTKDQRFQKDIEFDEQIRRRFGDLVEAALSGGLVDWEERAKKRLALIVLLDQFTRNIFRDHARAFSGDERALALCRRCVSEGDLDTATEIERVFILLPMTHSEELAVHEEALPLITQYNDARTLDFAKRHTAIIRDWGRYPHRNAALGRQSTAEELAFLEQPGSSF